MSNDRKWHRSLVMWMHLGLCGSQDYRWRHSAIKVDWKSLEYVFLKLQILISTASLYLHTLRTWTRSLKMIVLENTIINQIWTLFFFYVCGLWVLLFYSYAKHGNFFILSKFCLRYSWSGARQYHYNLRAIWAPCHKQLM